MKKIVLFFLCCLWEVSIKLQDIITMKLWEALIIRILQASNNSVCFMIFGVINGKAFEKDVGDILNIKYVKDNYVDFLKLGVWKDNMQKNNFMLNQTVLDEDMKVRNLSLALK